MTLAQLIKQEGRTQKWVLAQLEQRGIKRDKSYFNEWCNDKHTPRDEYILFAIADILGKSELEIKSCFARYRQQKQ